MQKLKYTVIKSEEQYKQYCETLETLELCRKPGQYEDEIEMLTLLIKTWDEKTYPIPDLDPVQLLHSLMQDHGLTQKEMGEIAGVVKSTISEILNYKRRMSKSVIRNFSEHFKIRQEALNKPYVIKEKRERTEPVAM